MRRRLAEAFALIWVVAAIVVYPVLQSHRQTAARAAVKQLGGRYSVAPNHAADLLPFWMLNLCGGENLYAVLSINLARSDVTDDDLKALLQFTALEQINLCGCDRITEQGLVHLKRLPRLKLIWLDGMSVEDAGRCITGEPMAASGR
jgi:hypothetical protein